MINNEPSLYNSGRGKNTKALKNTNGITLIALVITIVVMLILVSIGVSMALGKGGLVDKAVTGKQEALKSEAYFKIVQKAASIVAKGQEENLSPEEINKKLDEYFSKPEVQKELENIQKENGFSSIEEVKEKVLRDIGSTADTSSTSPSTKDEERKPMVLKINPNNEKKGVINVSDTVLKDQKIDWGDGTVSNVIDGNNEHEYSDRQEYTVKIFGDFMGGKISSDSNLGTKITQIVSWGENNFGTIGPVDGPKLDYTQPLEKSFESLRSYKLHNMEFTNEFFANAPNLEEVDLWVVDWRFKNIFENPIPENVFKNNPKLEKVSNLSNYKGPIPENLFANNPNLKSVEECFSWCTELKGSIPENLFANNPNLENIKSCFRACTGLTGPIPANLFTNNPNLEDATSCFVGCSGLTGSLSANLFANNPKLKSIRGCFSGCIKLTGKGPKFWEKSPLLKEDKESWRWVYRSCTRLSNYRSLPDIAKK